jgi:hypothetical protein
MIYLLTYPDKNRIFGAFSNLETLSEAVDQAIADGCDHPLCWELYKVNEISHIPFDSKCCFIPADEEWDGIDNLPRGVNRLKK